MSLTNIIIKDRVSNIIENFVIGFMNNPVVKKYVDLLDQKKRIDQEDIIDIDDINDSNNFVDIEEYENYILDQIGSIEYDVTITLENYADKLKEDILKVVDADVDVMVDESNQSRSRYVFVSIHEYNIEIRLSDHDDRHYRKGRINIDYLDNTQTIKRKISNLP